MISKIKHFYSKFGRYIQYTLMTIAICSYIGFINPRISYNIPNPSVSAYMDSIESQYVEARTELVKEVDNYIKRTAPSSLLKGSAIVDACLEYGVDIKFVLAQGHIESHFGTKGMAHKTNSVFNVYAYDETSASKMISNGRGFKHPNHSVKPYLALLTTQYMVNGKTEKDMMKKFVNKHGARYASDKNYESTLSSQYKSIDKTTKITQYQNTLITYKKNK